MRARLDEFFMRRALEFARRGFVSPNPRVGAVIVANGKIIAEGFHRKFGGDHAEIVALKKVPKLPLDRSTLYVTLEPCNFFGKTPPCVDAIVNSGIRHVVVAMQDPNPKVSGSGIAALRNRGIRVEVGLCGKAAALLNEAFIVWMKTEMPYVALKMAISLDGKIATKSGDSKWITSEKSRTLVRSLRDEYDAILVGKNTVLLDNPRLSGRRCRPLRIILDSALHTSPRAHVYRDPNCLVVTTQSASKKARSSFLSKGIPLLDMGNKISIHPLLRRLAKKNISSIFVEGGAAVFGSFFDARAVNKLYCFIAPLIIGGTESISAVHGSGISSLCRALHFSGDTVKKIGPDFFIEARVR